MLVSLVPALALALSASPARGADAVPASQDIGDLWEVTSQMTMEGMPPGMGMPARTSKICAARDWQKPPVAADEQQKCETIDFKSTPTVSTWKMHCAGPPAMDGNGEITRTSPEAYKGFIKMSSAQGAVTINLSGVRIGDCDAGQAKKDRAATIAAMEAQAAAGEKAAADAQAQAEEARKKACRSYVESMDLRSLSTVGKTMCPELNLNGEFCARLATKEGYTLVCKQDKKDPANGLTAAASLCTVDAEEMTKMRCDEAAKVEDLEVIGPCCPVQAKAIAGRECAGRAYTSAGASKYAGFCLTYASDVMVGGANAPTPPPESTKSKAKKTLKGLFGK